jgi:hypothetical protein
MSGGPGAYGVIGTGRIRVIVGTNPAAGVEVSETVPAGKRWRLVSFRVALTTSGTVANRFPALTLDDGTNTFSTTSAHAAQTATLTIGWTFGDFGTGQGTILANNPQVEPLPCNAILLPGYRIRTVTLALDAGDDYGAPVYCVEEWDQ